LTERIITHITIHVKINQIGTVIVRYTFRQHIELSPGGHQFESGREIWYTELIRGRFYPHEKYDEYSTCFIHIHKFEVAYFWFKTTFDVS